VARYSNRPKPPAGSQINWGHPLAHGLAGAWLLNEGAGAGILDLVSRRPAPFVGAEWSRRPEGPALKFLTAEPRNAKVNTSGPIIGGQRDWSVVGSLRTSTSSVSGGRMLYAERASSGNDIIQLKYYDSGLSADRAVITYRNDGGTLIQLTTNTAVPADNTLHHFAGVKRGTAFRIFFDGNLDNTGTFGSSSDAFTDAGLQSWIGCDPTSAASGAVGEIGYVYLYRRALSDAEVDWINSDPYAMVAPVSPVRRHFLSLAAEGGGGGAVIGQNQKRIQRSGFGPMGIFS
jgi:hypothetical protein